MKTITLTDDEVVAVAVAQGGAWRGPLPTVEDAESGALLAAAARGARSLRVRSGATGDRSLESSARELLAPGIDRLPLLLGYVANDKERTVPAGVSFAVLAGHSDGQRLLTVTSPSGISEVTALESGAAADFVTGLADAVCAAAGARVVIMVAPRDEESGRILVVAKAGSITSTYIKGAVDTATGDPVADVVGTIRTLLSEPTK